MSILRVLTMLTLSDIRGVGRFAQHLLKSERGISGSSTGREEAGNAQTWNVMEVLHDFSCGNGHDLLAINEGDVVAVQMIGERGWSYGRIVMHNEGLLVTNSRSGWFPSSYVRSIRDASPTPKCSERQPTGFVTVIHGSQRLQVGIACHSYHNLLLNVVVRP